MLDQAQKQFYDDNGYIILRNLFPRNEIAEIRRELFAILAKPWIGSKRVAVLYEKEAAGKDTENPLGVHYVLHSPIMGDRWFKLALDPRLVEPMIDLLGPDVNLHDQKMPLKPPGHVSKQGWH